MKPPAERVRAVEQFLVKNVRGVPIVPETVLKHVIPSPSFNDAASNWRIRQSTLLLKGSPRGLQPYYLDVPAFKVALHNALKDGVAGYVAQLRQSGNVLFTNTWQFAKRPQDGALPWTADVPMHVASVSKLLTAMAMTVLLRDNGISPDTLIIDYLPGYWAKGFNIQYITFRHLFHHTSGLYAYYNVNFLLMKSAIADGIDLNSLGLGNYNYQNVNYALFRLLLAIINGNIANSGNAIVGTDDGLWDFVTFASYELYLQAKVFKPSHVVGVTLDHPNSCALAYRGPNDTERGWNSGSLEESCGGDGWHLSVNQLLDVMGEFRRGGGILGPAEAQAMLDEGFGVDPLTGYSPVPTAYPTAAGNLYCKPGGWTGPDKLGNPDEQSLAYFLPEDMELAVFVNSQVDGHTESDNFFRHLVTQTYLENLTPQATAL